MQSIHKTYLPWYAQVRLCVGNKHLFYYMYHCLLRRGIFLIVIAAPPGTSNLSSWRNKSQRKGGYGRNDLHDGWYVAVCLSNYPIGGWKNKSKCIYKPCFSNVCVAKTRFCCCNWIYSYSSFMFIHDRFQVTVHMRNSHLFAVEFQEGKFDLLNSERSVFLNREVQH